LDAAARHWPSISKVTLGYMFALFMLSKKGADRETGYGAIRLVVQASKRMMSNTARRINPAR
jgi:hypothetical protein